MPPAAPTFADTLDDVSSVEGWMTDGQAARLWAAAARAQGMAVVQYAPEPIEGSTYRRIASLFELFNRRVAT